MRCPPYRPPPRPARGPGRHARARCADAGKVAAAGAERRALSGLAPPASTVLRIPLRGTRLRRAVDPGASADPAGLKARARPKARLELHAANLIHDGALRCSNATVSLLCSILQGIFFLSDAAGDDRASCDGGGAAAYAASPVATAASKTTAMNRSPRASETSTDMATPTAARSPTMLRGIGPPAVSTSMTPNALDSRPTATGRAHPGHMTAEQPRKRELVRASAGQSVSRMHR